MADNPISNSGITPTEPTPSYGPEKPRLGAGEEGQEPKPFNFGPEGGKVQPQQPGAEKPSLLDVAGDAARQQAIIPPPELSDHIVRLQQKLTSIQTQVQNSSITKNFTSDHYQALQKAVQKTDPDLQTIAKYSNGQYKPTPQQENQPVLDYIVKWINGAQGTLGGALDYLQTPQKNVNPADYLRLQYSVQRATQRGELFASIVGSSVSGIKTILSMQLG